MKPNKAVSPAAPHASQPTLRVHTRGLAARISPASHAAPSPLSSIAAEASSSSAFIAATRAVDATALSNLTGFDTITQRYQKGTTLYEATKIFDRQEFPQITAADVLGKVVLEKKEVQKVDLSLMRRLPKFAPMDEDPRRFLVRFVRSATELALARVDSVWVRAFYECMDPDEADQLQNHYTFANLVSEFDSTFRPSHDPEARLRACAVPLLANIDEYSSKKFSQHVRVACDRFIDAVDEHWESERDSKRFSIRAGDILLSKFPVSVQADLKAEIRAGVAGLEGLGRNHSIPVVYVVQALKHFLPMPNYWVCSTPVTPVPDLPPRSTTLTTQAPPAAQAAPAPPVPRAPSYAVPVTQADYFDQVEALAVQTGKGCFYCGKTGHRFRDCPTMQSDLDEGIVRWGIVGDGKGRQRLMACHGDRQVLVTKDYPMRKVAYAAAKKAGLTPSQPLDVALALWEPELCLADFVGAGPSRARAARQGDDRHSHGHWQRGQRCRSRSHSREHASRAQRRESRTHSRDRASRGRDPRRINLQLQESTRRTVRSRSRSESPTNTRNLPIIRFVADDHEARLSGAQRHQLNDAIAKEVPQIQTLVRRALTSLSSGAPLPRRVNAANGWVALSPGGRRQQLGEWTWEKKWENGLIIREEVARDLDALTAEFTSRLKEIAAYNYECQEKAAERKGRFADVSCVEFVSGAENDGVMSMESRPLKRVRGDDDMDPYKGPAEFVVPSQQQQSLPMPAPQLALEPPLAKSPTKRQLMARAINRVTDEAARMLAAQVLNAPVRGDDGFTFGHLLRFAPIRSAINRQLGLRGGRNPTIAQYGVVPPPAQPAPMTMPSPPPPAPVAPTTTSPPTLSAPATMSAGSPPPQVPHVGAQRTLRELLADPSPRGEDVDMFVDSLEVAVEVDGLVEQMIRELEKDPALCVAFAQRVPSCRALVERLLELEPDGEGLGDEDEDPSAFLVAAVERLRYRATTVRLPVTIARSNVPMLLDSGAMVSLLDASVADELGLDVVPSPEGKEHVRVANGAAAELVGVWQGEVTILGETRVAHFYVMHGLTRHALLGMPAIVDFKLAQIPEGESMVVRGRNGEATFPLVSTMGPAVRGIAPELLEVESWEVAGAHGGGGLREMVEEDEAASN
ncbi:hypothetical protein BCR44DRAFT_67167 [Catenaria anguillulae PL171]|uniref:CCHC-type domain-containing protein n=1 Tax=Catenaria anguillulae PL171 TaxID=765915 RepID=A0A1Y2H0M3_9FUNG|nr:hypothetical protein BCR44DRAFT_67167 [Catenaria anguillulae PL171]